MFCPNCKDEFREGFTRCEGCDVDLVDDLSQVKAPAEPLPALPADGPVRVADYCGFFTLEEARQSREILREKGIRSEVAIRDAPAMPGESVQEEYWLRVEATQMKQAAMLLDTAMGGGSEDETLCSKCGEKVAAEEKFCPHCGEGFDD